MAAGALVPGSGFADSYLTQRRKHAVVVSAHAELDADVAAARTMTVYFTHFAGLWTQK